MSPHRRSIPLRRSPHRRCRWRRSVNGLMPGLNRSATVRPKKSAIFPRSLIWMPRSPARILLIHGPLCPHQIAKAWPSMPRRCSNARMFSRSNSSGFNWRFTMASSLITEALGNWDSKSSSALDKTVGDLPISRIMQTGRAQLAAYRKRSRLKQNQLAHLLRIHDTYLSQLLSGRRRPGLDVALRIERLTGVPVESWSARLRGNRDLGKPAKTKTPLVGNELTDAVDS
jgi:plasmid maintenance system antidote protein VapI